MEHRYYLVILQLLAGMAATFAAAYTSSQTGNWSSTSTWGGSGPPGNGDTVSIGAHTITVDTNTTVGDSPNNTTNRTVNMTSASSILLVASNVTFTVKGNIAHVNGSEHRQSPGSTVTFDNSGSGGSTNYTFINIGGSKFTIFGSTIQAISGQTFGMGVNWNTTTISNSIIRRCSNLTSSSVAGNVSVLDSTFDSCDRINFTYAGSTVDLIFDRNVFTNGTHTLDDIKLSMSAATTTGSRRLSGNVLNKVLTYSAKSFVIATNYFAAGIAPSAGSTWTFRLNCIRSDGSLNGGNGQLLTDSTERNYWIIENASGNPHFVAPTALLSSQNNTVAQNIFEGHTPDLVDYGDAILVLASSASGGNKIIGQNNIVLPMGTAGTTCSSGTLLTLYNTTTTNMEFFRNTANAHTSSVGGVTVNGVFALAEAGTGASNQIAAFKSNVAWDTTSGNYLVLRQTGNVKDIITASGADYNWRYNLKDGDNQRSYEDEAASNTLWTAGDAVAAGVDVHQGTSDPQFYDSTRNIGSWSTARGYGSGYTNGVTAIMASPVSRIPDLIEYVFEGYRPGNTAMRNGAHDGGVVGAANFYKSTRKTEWIDVHRATLSKFGIN